MSDHNNNNTDNNYNLFIQVGAASFDYAVVDEKVLLAFGQDCGLDELNEPKQLADILTAAYKKVVIGLPAAGLTLVPTALFGEGNTATFAQYLDVKPDERVLTQTLDDHNTIVYKTKASLISAVEKFGIQNTVYTAEGWVKAVAAGNPGEDSLYLEIGKDTAQFLYFSAGKLRFYNTFEFKNAAELVYFTAFVTRELHLQQEEIDLVVSGSVAEGDEKITTLTGFFPKTTINPLKVLEIPEQISSQSVLALTALSLCGSSVAV
jgi:hypothetical protein